MTSSAKYTKQIKTQMAQNYNSEIHLVNHQQTLYHLYGLQTYTRNIPKYEAGINPGWNVVRHRTPHTQILTPTVSVIYSC